MRPALVLTAGLLLVVAATAMGLLLLGEEEPAPSVAAEEGAPVVQPEGTAEDRLRAGNAEGARQAFLRRLADDPGDVEAHAGLAFLALLADDAEEARLRADEVVRLSPGTPEAQAATAALAVASGSPDGRAEEAARAALEARPDLLLARWALATALIEGGKPCGAIPVLDPALAYADGLYGLHRLKLYAFNRAEDWTGHHQQLERMHERFPDDADVSRWLFESYESFDDPIAAASVLRDLARASTEVGPSLRLVEYVRRTQGEAEAEAELRRLADEAVGTPLEPPLNLELARSLAATGRDDEAIERLREIPAMPGISPVVADEVRVELARGLRLADEGEEARGILDAVLANDAGHVGALKERAALALEANAAEAALADLTAALAQEPENTSVMIMMAQAYRQKGMDALAGDTLARAVEVSDGGASERAALSDFLSSRGQDLAAERLLEPDAADEAPAPQAVMAAKPSPEADPAKPLGPSVCTG